MNTPKTGCAFCSVARGETPSFQVFEDERTFAFLDHRPLFPGHCLLITKAHLVTIADLPPNLIDPLFANVQLLAKAVQTAMEAEGSFIAINNVVSQSVPHFHVHIVPRRKGDGLKGFFWPRGKYKDAEEANQVAAAIRSAIAKIDPDRSK